MKPSTLAALHTIQRETAIKIQPRLIAEWEYNRFLAPTVTVTPDQSGDAEWAQYYGDTSTFVQPNRPVAGIAKARADDGMLPMGKYRDSSEATRYYPSITDTTYTVGKTSNVNTQNNSFNYYNYWSSLQRSQLVDSSSGYPFDSPIVLTVSYPQAIAVNKLVIGYELGYAKPRNTSIQITYDGVGWETISDNPAIDGEGRVYLWRNGLGQWTDIPDYENPIAITGVRVNVYSLDSQYAHLDVLAISPRLENDLTDYLIGYQSQFDVSSPSFIAPLGKASSNQATVTLSNVDGRFTGTNPDSLYYGMIEKKVKFTMDLGIDTSNQGGTPGVFEYIREFTMWTDSWGAANNTASQVQVQLKDSSVILQESAMPPLFLENATVGGIIGYAMDTIGLTNYTWTKSEEDLGYLIPYYWPSDTDEASNPRWGRTMVNSKVAPNTTIWDEFSALAEATQTALYFDQNDQLQIVARRAMYNNNKPVNWNLDAVPNGQKLPDVVSATSNFDLTANQVEVTYKNVGMSSDNNGFPIMATVWQPSDTVVPYQGAVPQQSSTVNTTDVILRASALVKDLTYSGTDLWVTQADAVVWPFDSDVNIEGEILHYSGKEYAYYDANNILQKKVVDNLTDQQALDALNQYLSWKNSYTGRFIVTARALYGSPQDSHNVSPITNVYNAYITDGYNTVFNNLGDGYFTQKDGYITQYNVTNEPHMDWTYLLRKHQTAVVPTAQPNGDKICWYGTRIRFPSGYTADPTNPSDPKDKPDMATQTSNWHNGGLYFAGDNLDGGLYLELVSTAQIDGWEQRATRNEVSLIAMGGNVAAIQLKGKNWQDASGKTDTSGNPISIGNRGFQYGILEDQWYDVDVSYQERASDGHALIAVYIDGVVAGNWELWPTSNPDTQVNKPANYTNAWRFGTIVRGPSMGVDFEMLYAVEQDPTATFGTPDTSSFVDLESGGYASGWLGKNVRYGQNNGTYIIDEFGPWVHEIRLFDVEFNSSAVPAPASFLYCTNPKVDCLSYLSDAFGAEFVLANADRQFVVANGNDTISGGSDNSVSQTLLIYGRSVYTAQNDSYIIQKNEDGIRRQGLIRTQFTTRYVQNAEMASEMAAWIVEVWGMGIDEIDCEIFGNPLLQIGDLVTMNYPAQGLDPNTHQYFVISVDSTYDQGYKTNLKLRRAFITGTVNTSV